MEDHGREGSRMGPVVESLFSLNTAFAVMSIVFTASLSAPLPFIHLEVHLNHLLGIRQTDYIRGYFSIWIPSLILAVCLLSLLRLVSRRCNTERVVRPIAGITILLCPTAVWTCRYDQKDGHFNGPTS